MERDRGQRAKSAHGAAPTANSDDAALTIYNTLREYEERFNASQAEIKKLASAWMLVTYSALAFVVRGELVPEKSLIDSAPLVAAIVMGSNIGLVSLWMIDQRIYQRLLNAVFTVGLELERRHADWPPIRSLMWVNSDSRGMARYHALFYAAPITFNVAAALYAFAGMGGAHNAVVIASTLVSLGALFVVLGDWFSSLGLERDMRANSHLIEEVATRWMR